VAYVAADAADAANVAYVAADVADVAADVADVADAFVGRANHRFAARIALRGLSSFGYWFSNALICRSAHATANETNVRLPMRLTAFASR
jgi:hypothetical protein